MRSKQAGSVIIVSLVVFVFAVIGTAGYAVYSKNKTTSPDTAVAPSTPANKTINSFNECLAAGNPIMESFPEQCSANGKLFMKTDASTNSKFLELEAWGVKIPIISPLTDLQFSVLSQSNESGEKQPQIKFYTKKSEELGMICPSNYSLITVVRGKADDIPATEAAIRSGNDTSKVTYKYLFENKNPNEFGLKKGEYYYLANGGGGSCSDKADTVEQTKEYKNRDLIIDALLKMETL